MRGEGFWKKIIVLCLTFWLGFFVWDVSVSKKAPKEPVVAETLNCVPDNTDLKYQFLSGDEKKTSELEEKSKTVEKSDKQSYRPGRDVYQYRTLLHKEHCYESKERK